MSAPATQTLRIRRPVTTEKSKPTARHTGILQDQLRRSSKPPWCPSFSVAFRMLVLVRFSAAMYSIIQDCDEVYNFWEPLHYLDNGYAFQTWELSPAYAIRSWAYILLHLGPLRAFSGLLSFDKRQAFFALRVIFAFASSFCEAKFYRAVADHVHLRVARYMLFALLFSTGMWSASTAFLPSTFTMYTTTLAYASAVQLPTMVRFRRTLTATSAFALGAIVGWPFAIVLAVPFVLEELFIGGGDKVPASQSRRWLLARFRRFLTCGLIASCLAFPCILADSYFYGRLVFVPWNIVRYNVLSGSEKGPDLYGTSPWHFYILNLCLNFNIAAPAALFSLPALMITYVVDRKRLGPSLQQGGTSPFLTLSMRLAPFYLWFVILTLQPHKEERFMYPAYPLICFNAATTLYLFRGWLEVFYIKKTASPYKASRTSLFSRFTLLVILFSGLVSVSRTLAITRYYHAPLDIAAHFETSELPRLLNATGLLPPLPPKKFKYTDLPEDHPPIDLTPIRRFNLSLCVGKEWYRFPGHYLVPQGIRVDFIKSDFDGLLPRHFNPSEGIDLLAKSTMTRITPSDLNDLNKEEPSHYIDVETCDYLVDLDFSGHSTSSTSLHEPFYALETEKWARVLCVPFLDAPRTPTIQRLLWLPGESWRNRAVWGNYCLLKNKLHAGSRESIEWS